MNRLLILGYGNIDRQDDGAAWHILERIKQIYNINELLEPGEIIKSTDKPIDLLFFPQLTPEISDILIVYSAICFIDAHTGVDTKDLCVEEVSPLFQTSPLTHHMSPSTILALTEMMYNRSISGLLVSIKGHLFEFEHTLSESTKAFVEPAVQAILEWIDQKTNSYT